MAARSSTRAAKGMILGGGALGEFVSPGSQDISKNTQVKSNTRLKVPISTCSCFTPQQAASTR
jgi:hypothetical protein